MSDVKYLPQGEDIFSCTKCKMHFILPSCCDHYQQDKIQELEAFKKEALDMAAFYARGAHFEVIRTRGEIIEYDVDAGPLYNYHENVIQKDTGEKAREFLKKHEVKE